MPMIYQPMVQPPLAEPAFPHAGRVPLRQSKQMSVEARPFVPGESPGAPQPPEMVSIQPEMVLGRSDPVEVVHPVWGSDGSDIGSSGGYATSGGPQAASVVVNGSM